MFGKKKAKQAEDTALLGSLASVVDGAVDRGGHLRGSYRGHTVDAWFEVIDTMPLMYSGSYAAVSLPHVDCLRLKLTAEGGAPWYVRSEPASINPLNDEHVYEFISEGGQHAFGKLSPFADMIAEPDRAIEARLEEAGLFDALTAIAPAGSAWVPRARFVADPRAAMREAMMARMGPAGMAKLPPAASAPPSEDAHVGLMTDVPRASVDLSPEGFAALLDAVCAIADLNERVNPPREAAAQ